MMSCWYAIRLITPRQEAAQQLFAEHNIESFIPMEQKDYIDKEGHRHSKMMPVVRNLIFIRKSLTENEIRQIITNQMQLKMSVYRKADSNDYYEISEKEMQEFQIMCQPNLLERKFLSAEQAEIKVGTPVKVTNGPLKGITGKLVRSSKRYYLLKEIPGIAVMLKVTKWCCQPIVNGTDSPKNK